MSTMKYSGGIIAIITLAVACGEDERCGPRAATVARVVDGDTVELGSGDRVRYIGIDTPESTNGADDCYGAESAARNEELVLGKKVNLEYDVECTDRFGRLLAYVSVDGDEVNRRLVAEGYACTLFIAPNGTDRRGEYEALQGQAKQQDLGIWGSCEVVTCE